DEARKLARNPQVKETIELSFGDSYKGRRIVGTSHKYIDLYEGSMAEGTLWEKPFEAVVGSQVAGEFDLKTGDKFVSAHGVDGMGHDHDDHPFTVVGVLNTSGSVLDKLILTAPESIWEVHADHGHDSLATQQITAMLVKFRNKMGIMTVPRVVN